MSAYSGKKSYLIDARVEEVAEDVAEVEAGHSELGYDHLEEGTEGGEDTELLLVETEPGSCAEVAALHNWVTQRM